jgi:hypothetical protein
MLDSDSEQARKNESLSSLVRISQKRFGELLRQICEISGITQGKLSREAKNERQRLIEKGDIHPDDLIGSMEQPTISKIMAGVQGPTYFQVYIWLRVIRAHFESARFAEICKELNIDLPEFSSKLEHELWRLSTFIPPDELHRTYENAKEIKLIVTPPDELHRTYENAKEKDAKKEIKLMELPSIVDHKEQRWERTKRRSTGKGVGASTKPLSATRSTYKTTTTSRRD